MPGPNIKSADDIKKLGRIFSVWAHPDDETFTSAGIISTAITNGQAVSCLTATKGEAGSQDESKWPRLTLGAVRAHELEVAMNIMGCRHYTLLDFPDGGCARVPLDEIVPKLRQMIIDFQPNTILTFGPDGITGHSDHIAVGQWVNEALKDSDLDVSVYHPVEVRWKYDKYMKAMDKKLNIYFNIDEPPIKDPEECNIYYELAPEVRAKKSQALAAMPSQTETLLKYYESDLDEIFSVEAFVRA